MGLKIAEKIRQYIADMSVDIDEETLAVTMSFGVATASKYSEIESAIKIADEKLYQAKHAGRDCVF